MIKRAILLGGGALCLLALAWALWPSDEQPPPPVAVVDPGVPRPRTLAEQLDAAEHEREVEREASDGGRESVTGLVLDEEGTPVADADVSVLAQSSQSLDGLTCPVCQLPILECGDVHTAHDVLELFRQGKLEPRVLGTTRTAADGTFVFPDLPQEDLYLSAQKGGLRARAAYSTGDEPVLTLSPPSHFALKILRGALNLDDPGVPLGGATVSAISLDTFQQVLSVSDGNGHLAFDGLDQGLGVWVLVEAPGLLSYVSTLYSDVEESEVLLEPSRALLVRTSIGGKPVETQVTVGTPEQHGVTQHTQGGFTRFEGLRSTSYQVMAQTEEMVAPRQEVMLEDAETTLELELRAAAKLMVTVIDEGGEPVVASVTGSGVAGDFYEGETTDGALVVLGPLGEGTFTVDVTGGDLRPWHRELDLHPGDNHLEVVLKKGVKVTGVVVDPDGKPVTGALVETLTLTQPLTVFSDADGKFELAFDEPGPEEVVASQAAAGKTRVTLRVPAEGAVIRLEARAGVKVFVHEGTRPVAGASVLLNEATEDGNSLSGVTGEDGNAVILGLESGRYEVTVHSANLRPPPPIEAHLTEGRVVSIDVPLDRGITISGIVVDERGAAVAAVAVQTEPWTSSVATDDDGHFTLSTLDPAQSYQVEAWTELKHAPPITFRGPQPAIRLVLGPRPMANGRVVDGVTGAPIVRFEADSQEIEAADGRFSVPITFDTEGKGSVTISAEGYETIVWQFTPEQAKDLGTLRLDKAQHAEGVVRDVGGRPVSGAQVSGDCTGNQVTSAADGSFRLELSTHEPGCFVTARRGQQKGFVPAQVGRLLEIVLNPPTKVSGQVLDSSGRPVLGAVTIRDAMEGDELQADVRADGTFTIDLAQGRWIFNSRASTSAQTFQIAGGSMRVVLGTPPGSCAMSVQSSQVPDELLLLPGESAPSLEQPFEQLAEQEGAVVFEVSPRLNRAVGFRCGTYTLVARWGGAQRLQRVDVAGGNSDLKISPPATR